MLVEDDGDNRTINLALGAEDLPLLDGCADLVICRNALDHMPNPELALQEMWRILHKDGALFISVDIGGAPTPDEPTVFSVESLSDILRERFEVATLVDNHPPHSGGRRYSVRVVAHKKPRASHLLDKEKILQAYEARLR
jgi:ubiquinone/menaquinone biosynthesis C-methylase UbiE